MRFIIGAQSYKHNSAGVRVLYELAARLKKMGDPPSPTQASPEATPRRGGYGGTWTVSIIHPFCIPKPLADQSIVVYPESITGNPCGASRVVRYILNVPGKMGGDKEYAKEELLVAYCDELAKYADGQVLYVPVIEDFFCKDASIKRTRDAMWIGKGINTNQHPTNCEEITMEYPFSRIGMARFLQTVGTFYTYDNFTHLIPEALRCGCRVVYLDPETGPIEIKEYKLPSEEEVKEQFETFIRRCREKWNIK